MSETRDSIKTCLHDKFIDPITQAFESWKFDFKKITKTNIPHSKFFRYSVFGLVEIDVVPSTSTFNFTSVPDAEVITNYNYRLNAIDTNAYAVAIKGLHEIFMNHFNNFVNEYRIVKGQKLDSTDLRLINTCVNNFFVDKTVSMSGLFIKATGVLSGASLRIEFDQVKDRLRFDTNHLDYRMLVPIELLMFFIYLEFEDELAGHDLSFKEVMQIITVLRCDTAALTRTLCQVCYQVCSLKTK